MTGHVVKLSRVLRDLDEAAAYIQCESSAQRAIRFLRAADSTIAMLAGMPGLGTRYEPDEPIYDGIRFFPISGHRRYLVFYRAAVNGIEVLRVLHGARDIRGIPAEEFGIGDDDDAEAEVGAEPD
jgi:toxin ParE1/3/4